MKIFADVQEKHWISVAIGASLTALSTGQCPGSGTTPPALGLLRGFGGDGAIRRLNRRRFP
jgi:hypothetical protein